MEAVLTPTLSEKKQLEIEAAEIGIQCFNSFYFFFKTFWPEMSGEVYHDNWHIKEICDILQEKAMKLIRLEQIMETIVINVPPGSSKSTIVTVAFPLWIWLRKPNFTTTNISYSATLSSKHAYLSRNITDSPKFHLLFDNLFKIKHGKELQIVKQNELEILNNFKGSRFNTSVGGTITGMHANIIIEDDPMNPEKAFSDAERANAIRFHDETISTRLKDFTSYLNIIIAQRLHEGDTCGHVLNQNIPITHICFPGVLTKNTKVFPEYCKKFYVDGLMDPIRKPQQVIDQLKIKLNNGFPGQILQMPFSLEEQAIRPSMFEIVNERDDLTFDLFIDGAYTENKKNDPTGLTVFGYKDHTLFVKQVYNVWKTLPDLLKFVKELGEAKIFDPEKGRIFIEPKASGYSLAQYIETETDYNYVLIGLNADKDEKNIVNQGKTARHNMIQPKAESNRIKLFKGNWNDEYLTQICGFPKAAHDEQVDNTGYAVNHYFFTQNMFIEDWAIRKLEKVVPGSVDVLITSTITKNKFSSDYTESIKGDVQLFDEPNTNLYHYRYICVAVLRTEGDRGGKTVIQVLDRVTMQIVAYFESDEITPQKAGKKAIEIAALFDNAKLAVAVQKEIGNAQSEEYDLSHIALDEIRKVQYENIYSRLTKNDRKLKQEREYGFEVNRSTTREVYYNLKEKLESNKISAVPLEVLDEIKLLERKKENGEVNAREGYQANAVLNYSIALKIHDEMYDKPKVKKSDRWLN